MSKEKTEEEQIVALKRNIDSLSAYILLRREEAQKKLDESKHEQQAAHELVRMIFEGDDRSKYSKVDISSYFAAEQKVRELRERISSLEAELMDSSLKGIR